MALELRKRLGGLAQRANNQVRRLRDRESYRRHGLVGPSEFWQEKRKFQIDFLRENGLQPQHTVLDVGCGTLRGGIPIIELIDAGNYVGTEVRREVIEEAKREVERQGLSGKRPQILISDDFSTLECDMSFDYAWAFSVLIHMSDEISASCVRFVGEHLTEGGTFFANVKIGKPRDSVGARGFPVVTRELSFYEAAAAAAGLSASDMGSLKSLGHVTGLAGDKHRMLRFTRT